MEGRAGCLSRPPDHTDPAAIIRTGVLGYLLGSLISEGSGEDEDDLVLCGAALLKDVLQHARQPHFRERVPDLLLKLALHSVPRILAELGMTAERQ